MQSQPSTPLTFVQKAIPKLKLIFVPAQDPDVPKRKRVLTSTSEVIIETSKQAEKKARADHVEESAQRDLLEKENVAPQN
jgi:hypothetical protein